MHGVTEHAVTAKPYSSDLLVSLLLFTAAIRWRRESVQARMLRTALVAFVAFWLSFTAVFVFGAVSLWLLTELPRHNAARWTWLLINVPPLLSFAAVYWFCIRAARDDFLFTYWADGFPDLPHRSKRSSGCRTDCGIWPPTSRCPPASCCCPRAARHDRPGEVVRGLADCAWPAPSCWPCWRRWHSDTLSRPKRITLYLIPSECLLAAAGLRWMRAALHGPYRWLWTMPLLACVLAGVYHESAALIAPHAESHLRPAVQSCAITAAATSPFTSSADQPPRFSSIGEKPMTPSI